MLESLLRPEETLRSLPAQPQDLPWGRWLGLGAGAVLGSLVYGASLGAALPKGSAGDAAWKLTLATGPSWLLLGLASWLFLRPRQITLWQLAQTCLVTMNYGIAVLLAGTPLNLLLAAKQKRSVSTPSNLGLIFLSNSCMLWLFVRQLKALGVPAWQAVLLWMLVLNGCGALLFARLKLFDSAS
jgi:hypothetical protein